MGTLHELYDLYQGEVAFFIVYIKEAHPEDGWVVTHNRDEDIAVMDPRSSTDRSTVADVMGSPEYLDLMTPKVSVGEQAFDFDLPRLDRHGERVRLSAFAGNQPVALIFGSYT